jgi:hypothetical protein
MCQARVVVRPPANVGEAFGRCLFVVRENSAIGYSELKWSAAKLAHPWGTAAMALESSHSLIPLSADRLTEVAARHRQRKP